MGNLCAILSVCFKPKTSLKSIKSLKKKKMKPPTVPAGGMSYGGSCAELYNERGEQGGLQNSSA